MTITVLLVDDHPVIRAGIRAMLYDAPELTIVGEAASGSAALTAARDRRPTSS